MAYRCLVVEQVGGIGRICINRPEVRNALNRETAGELASALRELGESPDVRVLLLRGAGERAFCAGADLKELAGTRGILERRRYFGAIGDVLLAMHETPVPIVGMVYGYALGGGLGLAAACDLLFASDDAVFGLPELRVGLFPMMVLAPVLRSVGRKKGLELFFRAHRVGAWEAERMGLVTRVVPRDRLGDQVEQVLRDIAAFSPALLRLGKEAARRAEAMPFREALAYLREMIAIAAATEDSQEGTAAFLAGRPPVWKGR